MITTHDKTYNQIVSDVLDELIKQEYPCRGPEGCVYSDDAGNHCAVGWLLPDIPLFMSNLGSVKSVVKTFKKARNENNFTKDEEANIDFIEANAEELGKFQAFHDYLSTASTRTSIRVYMPRDSSDFLKGLNEDTLAKAVKWYELNNIKIIFNRNIFQIEKINE